MSKGRVILENTRLQLTLDRLCHELIENHGDFQNTVLLGIQERGARFADRLFQNLKVISKLPNLKYGKLDVTFHRDDFRTRKTPLEAHETQVDFLIQDKNVILIDDVLYTGRTIVAALSAMQHFGRPARVELVSLVDRRFNRHLPIQSHYTGVTVDALDEAYVKVEWEEHDGDDRVLLFANMKA